MAANLDSRPKFTDAPRRASIAVDPDGSMLLSDDTELDPQEEAAEGAPAEGAPIQQGPPREREKPGFHADVQGRIQSYSRRVPGDWSGEDGGPEIQQLRDRARHIYWAAAPQQWRPAEVWNTPRLPNLAHGFLHPTLQDDIKLIASVYKDDTISNMDPFIVTAKRKVYLTKSDIQYFLRVEGVIEYRMMDALFAAVAAVPDVSGPEPRYDYGNSFQSETVALPAITWDHIYEKFRHLEGEGDPPGALPGYLPDAIDPATNQPGDPTNLNGILKEQYALLLPILLDGNHWMFAYIHFKRRTVLIVNPDYDAKDAEKQYRRVEKYLHYWNLQNLSAAPHQYPLKWVTLHFKGVTFDTRATRQQGSGLSTILSALLVVCDVRPNKLPIPSQLVDIRAFLAIVLTQGGFRGNYYFPHQDAGDTRPWGPWFRRRGFWNNTLKRLPISFVDLDDE